MNTYINRIIDAGYKLKVNEYLNEKTFLAWIKFANSTVKIICNDNKLLYNEYCKYIFGILNEDIDLKNKIDKCIKVLARIDIFV